MRELVITRQELAHRRARLAELQREVAAREQEFHALHGQVAAFMARYDQQLGALYLELDALESQLHTALVYLFEALQRHGVGGARRPEPPRASIRPLLTRLPAAAPLPVEPEGGLQDPTPPSLKQLYRRAAMRLHPDLASSTAERLRREQDMRAANRAYEARDRAALEALLLAAGEPHERVTGNNSLAMLEWLQRSEQAVQGRLRVVRAHLAALLTHPMLKLCQAVTRAETEGLDPLAVMRNRLHTQIAERRRELYIGQRLQPESTLAQDFLRRRVARMAGAPLHD